MADGPARVAIVGGGVAGITAAHLLSRRFAVTLFERNDYLGGHTNTRVLPGPEDQGLAVDTGFIVCNPPCYPLFYRFLSQLGVSLRNTNMSFGFYHAGENWGYTGPRLRDFLRAPDNVFRLALLRMLWEQQRFGRQAEADLRAGRTDRLTLGEYLRQGDYSPFFVNYLLIPLAAAVWSSPDRDVLGFHATTFLSFWHNHGMLDLRRVPQWQTVVGGSHRYVQAFRARFAGDIHLPAPVRAVRRGPAGVTVQLADGEAGPFAEVVLAAHADESLALLADPDAAETQLLGTWRYHCNPTVLHTDGRLLPPRRALWASWNYLRPAQAGPPAPVSISYWMNRLQGLSATREYFVTLNQTAAIDPAQVCYQTVYQHPVYAPAVVAAQEGLRARNGKRHTWYCGSYLGHGFHEDAVRSACAVAAAFDIPL